MIRQCCLQLAHWTCTIREHYSNDVLVTGQLDAASAASKRPGPGVVSDATTISKFPVANCERPCELEIKLAHGPNRCRYSIELRNALTISALMKLPLNRFSFVSQN